MTIKRHGFAITFVALALLAMLAFSQQVHAAATTTDSIGTFTFFRNLQLWERGEDVRLLQQFLNTHGFVVAQSGLGSTGNETTLFGSRTNRALIRFQKAKGLPVTGFLGPLTRAKIKDVSQSSSASTTPTVASLQAQLSALLAQLQALKGGATSNANASVNAGTSTIPFPWAPGNGYAPGFGGGGGSPTQTQPADVTSPTVAVTAPSNNATVTGSAITVSANATDDGSVAGVQFKLDTNTNIGAEDTSAPYSVTWNSTAVADGTHTIIAVARDGSGNYATSSVITITVDNNPPTVSVTAPTNGATVSASSVTVSASASDTVGVFGVQFKVNGVNVGSEDISSPYSTVWDSTATSIGSKTIVAVARDAAGNYATSTAITVTVDNTPPVISSISSGTPADTSVTITWTTDEAAISKVVYGTTSAYGFASSSASLATSHSISLSSLSGNATYHYAVVSTDAQGNAATSTDQTFATAAWALSRLVNVATNGDSITASGYSQSATIERRATRGWTAWLEQKLGWNYSFSRNYAVAGVLLADMTSYVTNGGVGTGGPIYGAMNGLSPSPDIVFQMGGTNDLTARTLGQMQTDEGTWLTNMLTVSGPPRTLQSSILPNGLAIAHDSLRRSFNAQLPAQLANNSSLFKFIDLESTYANPSNLNVPLPAYSYDTLHPSGAGALALANAVFSSLPQLDMLPAPAGVYPYALDAASDPTNIFKDIASANSNYYKFAGTGGSLSLVTGTCPTGWACSALSDWTPSAGSQPVVSATTDGANLNSVVITVPAGTSPNSLANTDIQLQTAGTTISTARAAGANLVNGGTYRAGIKNKIVGGTSIGQILWECSWSLGGTAYARGAGEFITATPVAVDALPDGTYDILQPEIMIPGSGTIQLNSCKVQIGFVPSATAGGTITVSRPYLRSYGYLPSWP